MAKTDEVETDEVETDEVETDEVDVVGMPVEKGSFFRPTPAGSFDEGNVRPMGGPFDGLSYIRKGHPHDKLIEEIVGNYNAATNESEKLLYSNIAAKIYVNAAQDTDNINQEDFRHFQQLAPVASNIDLIAQMSLPILNMGKHDFHSLKQNTPDINASDGSNAVEDFFMVPVKIANHIRGIYTNQEREYLAEIYSAKEPNDRLMAMQNYRTDDLKALAKLALAATAVSKVVGVISTTITASEITAAGSVLLGLSVAKQAYEKDGKHDQNNANEMHDVEL